MPAYARQEPQLLSIPPGDNSFRLSDVLHSTFCTQEHAANVPFSLWVETQHANECIRYYPAWLSPAENQKVMVYFPGYLLLRTSRGERLVTPSYKQNSPKKVLHMMQQWAGEANAPAILMGRPGTYGSSGNHEKSRQITEIELMHQSLNILKTEYRIKEFIVIGQSGGGKIAAAMLNIRKDVSAAVLTAGLLPVHRLSHRWRKIRRTPGVKKHPLDILYDPTEYIANITKDPQPTIIVISDPRDLVIPFDSHIFYVNKLKKEGLTAHHIFAHAPPPKRHILGTHGQKAAALIAKGASIKDIRIAMVSEDMKKIS